MRISVLIYGGEIRHINKKYCHVGVHLSNQYLDSTMARPYREYFESVINIPSIEIVPTTCRRKGELEYGATLNRLVYVIMFHVECIFELSDKDINRLKLKFHNDFKLIQESNQPDSLDLYRLDIR